MTCRDCIHYYVCATKDEKVSLGTRVEELIADNFTCFKNKADFVEVVHSRWENISGFDVCNICGTSPAYCEPKPNNERGYPPYCHNCGAKMDGERKKNDFKEGN